jgi:spore coat protein H
MIRILSLSLVLLTGFFYSPAQNTLFDDSRVSSVYIQIPPDSLNFLMENVLSEQYIRVSFVYEYGSGSDTLQDVGFRLRGNTSRYSQKKSFKISFNEYVQGRKYQDVKKINLNGQHNDPTMIREKLFYDTWKKVGLPERRTSFVKLFINDSYYGLYTNLEELDKNWLERVFPENDGNLYKCTYPADLVYKNAEPQTYKNIESGSATGGRAYDLQTNESIDDYSDLVELITTLKQPTDSTVAATISTQLNVNSVLKAFALDVATGNWDDYMYNKNNYFLYHNLSTGKFEFISYDTDNTFGVDWVNQNWATRNCMDWYAHSEPRPLAQRLLSFPAFNKIYREYLDTIARYIILPDSIFPHIESMKTLVTAAAADDTYRSLDYGYTMSDFFNGFNQTIDDHTPYGIKPFLTLRRTKILEQLPTNAVPGLSAETLNLFSFYPNPANNEINVTFLGTPGPFEIIISDMSGKQLIEVQSQQILSKTNISLNSLSPGIYIVMAIKNGKISCQKLVKK